MKELSIAFYKSPVGILEITASHNGVVSVIFSQGRRKKIPSLTRPNRYLKECLSQIDEYFKGQRKTFNVKLDLEGSDFELAVWLRVKEIPFGKTLSYGDVARCIGKPLAARAVGGANHRNPLTIIIPCHRVVGSDGALVGYGGGLWRKQWLLDHEKKYLNDPGK